MLASRASPASSFLVAACISFEISVLPIIAGGIGPLVPIFRSSCSIAAPTFTNVGKSWALANLLILVPLYRSEVPDRIRSFWCRDFRSAVLARREGEIGGAVARPDRTFDGRRQPRISPVAGKKQVFKGRLGTRTQGVLFRGCLKCGTALAHNLPGRHFGCDPRGLADIPPNRLRQLLARVVHQPVGAADRDRQPLREREQPFHQPPN